MEESILNASKWSAISACTTNGPEVRLLLPSLICIHAESSEASRCDLLLWMALLGTEPQHTSRQTLCSAPTLPEKQLEKQKKEDQLTEPSSADTFMNYYISDPHSNANVRMCQEQIRLSAVETSPQKKKLFSRHKRQAALPMLKNTKIKIPFWKSHLGNSRLYQNEDKFFLFFIKVTT